MNKQELIKRYENTCCTLISINGVLEDLKQLDEPQPIKLKDVIARIKNFDLATKAVWINEILNKLGSDYGLHKYYAGYKKGKFDGAMEREKATIPQFVADWIENVKRNGLKQKNKFGFYEEITSDNSAYRVTYYIMKEGIATKDIRNWVGDNTDAFARAWLDGYTVEKEKRYIVKVKNIGDGWEYLKWNSVQRYWYFGNKNRLDNVRLYHTLENLQKGGFGHVFVNPLFTIEEVEE